MRRSYWRSIGLLFKSFVGMNAFEHVGACAPVCLNTSLGAYWCESMDVRVIVCVLMRLCVNVNRCTG